MTFSETTAFAVTACLALAPLASGALAAGNLASKPTNLELKIDSKAATFSAKELSATVGKYYKWHISGDGGVMFQAPDLFGNSWINLLGVNVVPCKEGRCDAEILPAASFDGIAFNGGYGIDIFFVPLKAGDYDFYVKGMEAKGLTGKFHVVSQ